jgi:hypothetical protein
MNRITFTYERETSPVDFICNSTKSSKIVWLEDVPLCDLVDCFADFLTDSVGYKVADVNKLIQRIPEA